ncbi:MAG: ATP-dependent DNA helicase RecG [Firmicutes bacterium]|nr:ATP-dependent DNA helicase RecG [Bacillota bacterium]
MLGSAELLNIKGVGAKMLEKLNAIGIFSVKDLVNFLPKNYVDLDACSDLDMAINGEYVLVSLKLYAVSKPFRKRNLQIFACRGLTESGIKVKLTWYNANYASKNVKDGCTLKCYGKLIKEELPRSTSYELVNPVYEVSGNEESALSGIKPIYATRGLIPQANFISMIDCALNGYQESSVIPNSVAIATNIADLTASIHSAHKPQKMGDIFRAKERVFLEETVKRICAFKLIKESASRSVFYNQGAISEVERIRKSLPYTLTETQNEALSAIINTLTSNKPLNAMLTGDVGSGKTIVALLACVFAVAGGKQTALIAPTEILAVQHFNSFNKIIGSGIEIALLTGGMTAKEKSEIKARLKKGEIKIIIGTHAVFSKSVDFQNLALVVADEQHRFGVAQRTALINKSENCDVLTLSATPIPRSLRLTMFGEIDVLPIEKRHESTNIKTKIVPQEKRREMFDYIVSECQKGKQAFLVAPRIHDDEDIQSDATLSLYKELTKLYGNTVNIAHLHGKMSSAEKTRVITAFNENAVQMLVSTTVIEVGIDVPNASLMVIFDAEHFGLATLHQLRGRIGRDGGEAYCFLYTAKKKETEITRLRALVEVQDGLKLAERDLENRGAGDFLGESQSGKGFFRPSIALIKKAKETADLIEITENNINIFKDYAEKLKLTRISLT